MSVLSRERVADAEAAETRGRMQQLAWPVVLVRAAAPRAKTAGLAARSTPIQQASKHNCPSIASSRSTSRSRRH